MTQIAKIRHAIRTAMQNMHTCGFNPFKADSFKVLEYEINGIFMSFKAGRSPMVEVNHGQYIAIVGKNRRMKSLYEVVL